VIYIDITRVLIDEIQLIELDDYACINNNERMTEDGSYNYKPVSPISIGV